MNKMFRPAVFLLALSFSMNFCIAQKTDTIYNMFVDSSIMAYGKISLKLKGDFRLTKQQDAGGTRKLEFKSPTDLLVTRIWYNINDSTATKMMTDKKFLIENLFLTQPSPYPDIVSNQVECPERLKPAPFDTAFSDIRIFAFRLYANDRYIYGECIDDVIRYTSAYILIYNLEEKILTEIKYFTPKLNPVNTPEEVMRNIR